MLTNFLSPNPSRRTSFGGAKIGSHHRWETSPRRLFALPRSLLKNAFHRVCQDSQLFIEQCIPKVPSRLELKQCAVGALSCSVLPLQRMAFPSLVGAKPVTYAHLTDSSTCWIFYPLLSAHPCLLFLFFFTNLFLPHYHPTSALYRNIHRSRYWNRCSQSCRRLYSL